ncbi:uncharacterized protein LY89DRAFT_668065 [Mollisia scopiformis]|uniref:Helicase ATP-binding domain-containing protein n=1 Tax=Mollisia scopiformis TaxID=149040 RepID=A0A194XCE2_MOLSC|nr:uncharacterized protein LY89DRAFT_668065 [Mollisia scopiformis]KUJ17843.1 hypothetical protein LY89DRAFT_668065 [Mollisia scopiformis]
MATSEGKSLLFMLPCILPDARVTILVLLLVFLRGDLLRRVRELGIDHLVWSPGEQRDVPLVFITVEAACTEQFRTYAHKLAATQDLSRIVFDEAHLTITASDYRQAIVDLALIRNVPEQKEELLRMWLASSDQPYIVATAGLALAPSLAPSPEPALQYTGSAAIQEKRRRADLELSRYQEDLLAVQGTCLLCKAFGDAWDHAFPTCWRRFEFFEARNRVKDQKQGGGPWITPYHACY